jgi:hypothetical protein
VGIAVRGPHAQRSHRLRRVLADPTPSAGPCRLTVVVGAIGDSAVEIRHPGGDVVDDLVREGVGEEVRFGQRLLEDVHEQVIQLGVLLEGPRRQGVAPDPAVGRGGDEPSPGVEREHRLRAFADGGDDVVCAQIAPERRGRPEDVVVVVGTEVGGRVQLLPHVVESLLLLERHLAVGLGLPALGSEEDLGQRTGGGRPEDQSGDVRLVGNEWCGHPPDPVAEDDDVRDALDLPQPLDCRGRVGDDDVVQRLFFLPEIADERPLVVADRRDATSGEPRRQVPVWSIRSDGAVAVERAGAVEDRDSRDGVVAVGERDRRTQRTTVVAIAGQLAVERSAAARVPTSRPPGREVEPDDSRVRIEDERESLAVAREPQFDRAERTIRPDLPADDLEPREGAVLDGEPSPGRGEPVRVGSGEHAAEHPRRPLERLVGEPRHEQFGPVVDDYRRRRGSVHGLGCRLPIRVGRRPRRPGVGSAAPGRPRGRTAREQAEARTRREQEPPSGLWGHGSRRAGGGE